MQSTAVCTSSIRGLVLFAGLALVGWAATVAAQSQPGSKAPPPPSLPLRSKEGGARGFLEIRTPEGKVLAAGDLIQTARGNRVTSRLTFHYADGSVDDETTVFSQDKTFHLISDHHIQKGPTFPHPYDTMVDVPAQQVHMHDLEKGEEKTEHVDMPPDLANGLVFTIIKNLSGSSPQIEVPFLSSKARMVKVDISAEGEDPFKIGVRTYQAKRFVAKVKIGGVSGVVAPMVGKQPKDSHMWLVPGPVPAIVRVDAPMYDDGPMWSIQLVNPSW